MKQEMKETITQIGEIVELVEPSSFTWSSEGKLQDAIRAVLSQEADGRYGGEEYKNSLKGKSRLQASLEAIAEQGVGGDVKSLGFLLDRLHGKVAIGDLATPRKDYVQYLDTLELEE